jgi:lipoprotein-anchoring transpeptidase ErfK/SrfK
VWSSGRRSRVSAGLVVAAVAAASASPASAQSDRYERVSDERTETWWAYVEARAKVRRLPATSASRVGTVKVRTHLGSPDSVVVLARQGRWSRVRYSGLGRRTGWVPTRVLSAPKRVRAQLVIDRARRRIALYEQGKRVFAFDVGVGAPGSPTPAGRFYVREKVIPSASGGIYGPVAYGLSAHSKYRTDWPGGGQVGVHGTNEPGLIPGRISNGCVRLRNRSIRRLARRLRVGTPVLIR